MERVNTEIRSALVENLQKLIYKEGSVTAFGRSIGVTRDSVNNWLSGRSDIRLNDLVTISKKYDVSVDYLLGLSDIPAVDPDMRTAIQVTGLSQKAIETVKHCDPIILSDLLEPERFCALVVDIEDLMNCEALLAEQLEGDALSGLDNSQIEILYNQVRLMKYEIRDAFSVLVEQIAPSLKILSHAKKILRNVGGLSATTDYDLSGDEDDGERS